MCIDLIVASERIQIIQCIEWVRLLNASVTLSGLRPSNASGPLSESRKSSGPSKPSGPSRSSKLGERSGLWSCKMPAWNVR